MEADYVIKSLAKYAKYIRPLTLADVGKRILKVRPLQNDVTHFGRIMKLDSVSYTCYTNSRCHYCNSEGNCLSRCDDCDSRRYCNIECKNKGQQFHNYEQCETMKKRLKKSIFKEMFIKPVTPRTESERNVTYRIPSDSGLMNDWIVFDEITEVEQNVIILRLSTL